MAVAIYGSTTASWNSGSSHSYTHDSGSGDGRLLVVMVSNNNTWAQTVTAITYGGVSLTRQIRQVANSPTSQSMVDIWYLIAPASGSNSVVVSHAATYPYSTYSIAVTLTGCDQSTAFRDSDSGTGTGSLTLDAGTDDVLLSAYSSGESTGWGGREADETEFYDTSGNSYTYINASASSEVTTGTNSQGSYSSRAAVTIWPPQNLSVDLSGSPILVSSSLSVGTIDDGNISITVGKISTLSATISVGAVQVQQPILGEMFIGVN